MKALLLRVGIDTGTDGVLAPLFDDGSFEFIPISEGDQSTKETRTYKTIMGTHGQVLAKYLPQKVHDKKPHFDPEFKTFTYGDPTRKSGSLKKLEPNDLLVFYAGLIPHNTTKYPKALYIIGYFTIEKILDFDKLSSREVQHFISLYANNAHFKRNEDFANLVVIVGDKKKSKLLQKAILISAPKLNKIGRPYHAVSNKMEKRLGISGSIQRSITPRFISETNINNLKKILENSKTD